MAKYIAIVQPTDNKLSQAEGTLVGQLTEGSHKISTELTERKVGRYKDYDVDTVEEEIGLTFDKIKGDKGQEQFKQAAKAGKQIKVWLAEVEKNEDGKHNTVFGYTLVEDYEGAFDDEEDTIEVSAKFKINSADGELENLPEEWLNPAELAKKVEFEKFGEYEGTLENRKKATQAM